MFAHTQSAFEQPSDTAQDSDKSSAYMKAGRKGKRGSLSRMPHMPVDILIEIMSNLTPIDLLYLARTSRDFRSLLMTRSASPLWEVARQNVDDLPECPPDLSEPAYANLAYDTHCHACLQPGTKTILWALRTRLCYTCRVNSNLLVWCRKSTSSACISNELRKGLVLPHTRPARRKGHWHLASTIHDMAELCDFLTKEELRQMNQQTRIIMDHAHRCEQWHTQTTMRRTVERHSLRSRRLEAVVKHLKELGWGDILVTTAPNHDRLRSCPEIWQTKELTEREWGQIQSTVVAFICEIQIKQKADADEEQHTLRCPRL